MPQLKAAQPLTTLLLSLQLKCGEMLRTKITLGTANSKVLIVCTSFADSHHPAAVAFLKKSRLPWRQSLKALQMTLSRGTLNGWTPSGTEQLLQVCIEVFEDVGRPDPQVTVITLDLDRTLATLVDGYPEAERARMTIDPSLLAGDLWSLLNNVVSKLTGTPPLRSGTRGYQQVPKHP